MVSAQFANTIGLVVRFLEKYTVKKLLQRLAARNYIHAQVRKLHGKIDDVFTLAGLSDAPQMVEWKDREEDDRRAQHALFEEVVDKSDNLLADGLSGSALTEAMTELKFEVDSHQGPRDFNELLARALTAAIEQSRTHLPRIPSWYIRRDDVEIGTQIGESTSQSLGEIYNGMWKGSEEVCVKTFLLFGPETLEVFLMEAALWRGLSHPNVIKMLGGCHVGVPLFLVSELARKGNFADYFDQGRNKGNFWRLFLQVAQGLTYLHSNRIIHYGLKCTNLLVDRGGVAKICNFASSHIFKEYENVGSVFTVRSVSRWIAPSVW